MMVEKEGEFWEETDSSISERCCGVNEEEEDDEDEEEEEDEG